MARRELSPAEKLVILVLVVMGLAHVTGCQKRAETTTTTAEQQPAAVPETRPTSEIFAAPSPVATSAAAAPDSVPGKKKSSKKKIAKKESAAKEAPTAANPPASPSDIGAELTRLKNSLPPGEIAYAPEREMRQGVETSVTARVGRGKVPGLATEFPPEEGKVEVQPIQVSMRMTAKLEYDETEFKVIPKEPSEKVLVDTVEWRWRVTPLKTGLRHLNLRLSGQVKLPDGSEGPLDVPVKEAAITVRVNPPYVVKEFVAQNWQWIIGGPVGLLAIGAWLRGWLSRKRPGKRR